MHFTLLSYKVVTSKKNGKDYIIYNLLYNDTCVSQNCSLYNNDLRDFLDNNINEDITEYTLFRPVSNSGAFRPYIKYK